MTSWARWFGRVVSVYMPGRRLTGLQAGKDFDVGGVVALLIVGIRAQTAALSELLA